MDRLRRSFRDSFRKRKDRMPESSKPHQWQADESAVRSGTCTFSVKYLGCVEVFESRGMQVCEEALKVLRGSRRRPVRAILHVSGDGLRVVEDETKGLIVDQTIEKVSFCAPDRNHERGFSYICRDGTTRRWMCHGFLALRESGERLSHAVGCAFAVCLERKQKRDKECGVTMMFDAKNSTFTRSGSFRQPGLTERLERGIDVGPSAAGMGMGADNRAAPVNPFAIERPHATPSMLQRQGSCRGFSTLGQNSPFKRQMSLRVNELPSNTARLNAYKSPTTSPVNGTSSTITSNNDLTISTISNKPAVSPIPEISPADSVTALCQQLSRGLSQLTHSGSDDFNLNNQTSVNQNTLNLNVTTINNTFNQAITTTPQQHVGTTIGPISLTFSPDVSQNPTPVISRSTIEHYSTNNSITSSNASTLPKPDQWLGQIVNKSASPILAGKMDGTSPRRAPSLSLQSKALSLDSSSGSGSYSARHRHHRLQQQSDPFDAEWAEVAAVAKQQNNVTTTGSGSGGGSSSTNPFLSPKIAPQPFQIQL